MNTNLFIIVRVLAVAAVVALFAPAANANLILTKSSAGFEFFNGGSAPTVNNLPPSSDFTLSQFGSLIGGYCNIQTHIGNVDNCFLFDSSGRSGSIQYDNQGTITGATGVIVQDSHNNYYVWDVSNYWNGSEDIDIQGICKKGSHITCIQLYGNNVTPTSSVPEPSTIIAGALLLLPFGFSTLRILRKHKMQPVSL